MSYSIFDRDSDDASRVVDLICDLCDEINYDYVREDISRNFDTLTESGILVTFCQKYEGVIVGVLGFYVSPEIFNSKNLKASEAFFYTSPTHRGGGGGLLDYAERSLREGVTVELGVENERLLRFMRRKGYNTKKTIVTKVV